jgi:signal transduction histidine kinase
MRIFLLFLFLALQLFSDSINFTKDELKWMDEHPTITYVGDPHWLPFEGFDKEDKYIGIVADLLKHIENTTPLKFKIIKTKSWDESIKVMKSNQAMMMSQSQDFNTKSSMLFSKVYYENPIVIVMDKNQRYVSSLHNISDKKIATTTDEPFFNKIHKKYPHIKFIKVNDVKHGLESVAFEKNDAFVYTLAQTSYTLSQLQLNELRIVGKTEFTTKLGFGISQQHPQLKNIIDKVLSSIDGKVKNTILSNWIRQKYAPKPDYTALYIAIAIFMDIFIMGLSFYIKLKKETNARIDAQNKMLKQQSKMASMGEMLDSVAHQWKQPLNAITMYIELLKSDFEDGLVDKTYIDEMQEGTQTQIDHMTTTLQEFRNFFRPNHAIEDFNLLNLTNSVLLLTKDEFLKNQIDIILQIDEKITLKGNQNEFKHLIINIINNAKDAFIENNISNRKIVIKASEDDKAVLIEIEDNAGGIPSHAIKHIFEANFTTKEKDKGTGIGLYMSVQILKKMGGEIDVKNINEGACFYISIPKTKST